MKWIWIKKDIFKQIIVDETTVREHLKLTWLSMRLDSCFFTIMIFNTTFLVFFFFFFFFKQVILSSVILHAMPPAWILPAWYAIFKDINKKEGGGNKTLCLKKILYGLIQRPQLWLRDAALIDNQWMGNYLWNTFGNGLKDVTALKAVGELSFSNKKGKKYLFSNISDWNLSF